MRRRLKDCQRERLIHGGREEDRCPPHLFTSRLWCQRSEHLCMMQVKGWHVWAFQCPGKKQRPAQQPRDCIHRGDILTLVPPTSGGKHEQLLCAGGIRPCGCICNDIWVFQCAIRADHCHAMACRWHQDCVCTP